MNALKVIIYFSIFRYPLKKEEIYSFSSAKIIQDIECELNELESKKIIFRYGEFYSDIDDESLVDRRLKGNKMAKNIMPKALKRAKLIMSFPFIESVSISGALSKNYYDNDGDIDFFIITKPKYLWLARTLLIAYKKLFLFNSRKYFCVNYFISSDRLEIAEKNTFTATELKTLIPVYGKRTFYKFLKCNVWANDIYPNKNVNDIYLLDTLRKPIWSKIVEFMFSNGLGRKIDLYFKKITLNKWKSKFKHLKKSDFEIAMKSTNDVSKHHPKDFQSKVICRLNERCDSTNKAYNLNLVLENA